LAGFTYTLPDGRILDGSASFKILDGEFAASYPPNWLTNVKPEQLTRRGIVKTAIPDPEPVPPSVDQVKGEAQRRIYEVYPQWKQANMTARAVELVRKGEANWTAQEQAESQALDAAWVWVKSIREKSNTLESMKPIPTDYTNDSYWE
jgi:hypothetical protein